MCDVETVYEASIRRKTDELESEIKKLKHEAMKLRQELENIATAKPMSWDDPKEFTPWAQNRARHALDRL